jgi:hypothetical protein
LSSRPLTENPRNSPLNIVRAADTRTPLIVS